MQEELIPLQNAMNCLSDYTRLKIANLLFDDRVSMTPAVIARKLYENMQLDEKAISKKYSNIWIHLNKLHKQKVVEKFKMKSIEQPEKQGKATYYKITTLGKEALFRRGGKTDG